MKRNLFNVGRRVEPQQEPDRIADIPHTATDDVEVGSTVGAELAKGSEALQAALKQAAVAVGNGLQDRRDEVIGYVRREPMAALTAAAGFGFLVGLALAISSRAATGGGRARLPQLNSRRGFLRRGTGSGWRGFLRLT